MSPVVVVSIRDDSDLIVARRHVREAGERARLSAAEVEALATAVTEVARNMVVHAHLGELRIEVIDDARRGVTVHARDVGPGIPDIARAMEDGYSTAASLGLGLPSAQRLVDDFEIESTLDHGTSVLLRKWASGRS
jgi:serine/threonine-protein kinase RsbT